jgi:hypothetical protein
MEHVLVTTRRWVVSSVAMVAAQLVSVIRWALGPANPDRQPTNAARDHGGSFVSEPPHPGAVASSRSGFDWLF